MATDHIRYDLLAQDALRGLVRKVLTDTAKSGLPGDHHFSISFRTDAEGVKMSPRLREQFPGEMTVILQYQFWDLKVTDSGFEVGLSFGGVPEKLAVPFSAIKSFFDPSVQFGLQFETIEADAGAAETPPAQPALADGKPAAPAAMPEPTDKVAAADKPTGEVVRLDRFRKK
ncbi:MAG: SspB family protein [Pseudorhodoplanes sp.]|uniref:SspB family protein n=1 Tax=Pseudorhodoplanes sp. TaxID=1934341 RepID=UPI003D0A0D25